MSKRTRIGSFCVNSRYISIGLDFPSINIFRIVLPKGGRSSAFHKNLNDWSAACLKGRSLDPSCSTYTLQPLVSSFAKKTNYSMYADDTDLYLISKPSELTENIAELERTAGLVRRWMTANELKMNYANTEVMLITPRRMAMKIECRTLVIGDHAVAPCLSWGTWASYLTHSLQWRGK